jgi:hypothetical protein
VDRADRQFMGGGLDEPGGRSSVVGEQAGQPEAQLAHGVIPDKPAVSQDGARLGLKADSTPGPREAET